MRLCSSEVKFTSLAVVRSISSTKPSSDSRMLRWELEANSPKANRCFMSMMSSAMDSATPGRRTFTATVVPSSSVALCTWAMEAAPKGTGVDGGEHLVPRLPVRAVDLLDHHVEGHRVRVVAQLLEVLLEAQVCLLMLKTGSDQLRERLDHGQVGARELVLLHNVRVEAPSHRGSGGGLAEHRKLGDHGHVRGQLLASAERHEHGAAPMVESKRSERPLLEATFRSVSMVCMRSESVPEAHGVV